MRLLFDHNVPAPLRRFLPGHQIAFADEYGWRTLTNGGLLSAAETAGFEVLLTCDQSIPHEQSFLQHHIGLVVLSSGLWPEIRAHVAAVAAALELAGPGVYFSIPVPKSHPRSSGCPADYAAVACGAAGGFLPSWLDSAPPRCWQTIV